MTIVKFKNLAKRRKEMGLSYQTLAQQSKVSAETILALETGTRDTDVMIDDLSRLGKSLKVGLKEVLTGYVTA